jgi:Phospholipase_D-nuclease N-terminal
MGFWDLFILLAVFIPLTILWVTCIIDLFKRHDLSGWARAAWALAIIVLPALGSLGYIAFGGLAGQHDSEATASAPRDDAMRMTGRTPYR